MIIGKNRIDEDHQKRYFLINIEKKKNFSNFLKFFDFFGKIKISHCLK